ncbi:uncharacterized protein LOC102809952 [Saccoglossus kowalevskii]|uniref:Uncharacterized protein LOC102809952 n=1 Tax=Saccoglossus kowalevskii TaxID=10224 RepID=A0ABM0MLP4_SACKO|nr:PREDICTED: uncharacterized protein LOC102809952 [Saccoglossus kowalevskii]
MPEVSTVQPNGKLGTDLAVGLGAGAGIVLICVMLAMYIMKRKFFSASAPTNEDSRAILEPSICDSETFPPPPPPPLSYTYYEPTNEELSRRAYDNNRAATRDDTRSETIEGQSASVHSDGYTCQTDMLDFNTDETVDPVCLTGASYDHDPRCHAGNFDTDMQVYNDTLEFDHQQQVFSATFDPVYYPQVFDGNFDYQGNNDRTGNMCLDDNVTCNNTNEDNSGERHDSGLGADSISIDI